jgi:hypothetical protein
MHRYKAFAIHMACSIAIVSAFLALMLFIWYPTPYFEADGAYHVVVILASVDVILGPLLTLIIFKPGKPGLKLDLGLIALIQLSALIYGANIIYTERPSYVVHTVDAFKMVSASMIDPAQVTYAKLKPGPFSRPKFVFARLPDDPQQRSALLMKTLATGKDLESLPEYYEPYEHNVAYILDRAKPLALLQHSSMQAQQAVNDFLAANSDNIDQFVYVPLIGKNRDLTLVLDRATGIPSGTLFIDPFVSEG